MRTGEEKFKDLGITHEAGNFMERTRRNGCLVGEDGASWYSGLLKQRGLLQGRGDDTCRIGGGKDRIHCRRRRIQVGDVLVCRCQSCGSRSEPSGLESSPLDISNCEVVFR